MIGPIRRNTSCWTHRHIRIANFDTAGVALSTWSEFRSLPSEMQVKHFTRYYKFIKNVLISHFKTQYPSGSKIGKGELEDSLNETLDEILMDCKRIGVSEESAIITQDSVSDEEMTSVRELQRLSKEKLPKYANKTTKRKSQPNSPKKSSKRLRCASSSAVSTIAVPCSSESLLNYGPSTSTAPAKHLVDCQTVPEEAIDKPNRLPKQLDPGLPKLIAHKLGVFPKKFTTYVQKVQAVLSRTEHPDIDDDFRFQCFMKIADVLQFDDTSKYLLFYVKYYKPE